MAAKERLDALILGVVGEWDRDQGWALDGAISPVAWLAHRLPVTRQDASVLVRSARHVAQHEKTAKALDAGDITASHGHGPISPALAQTLACDAAIGRVLMCGTSEVLDVGRQTRLVTATQRRALQIRDVTCVEEGCTIPGDWCDAHHIVHWINHGPTDLENLEFRCRSHHLRQHQRDLEATLRKQNRRPCRTLRQCPLL